MKDEYIPQYTQAHIDACITDGLKRNKDLRYVKKMQIDATSNDLPTIFNVGVTGVECMVGEEELYNGSLYVAPTFDGNVVVSIGDEGLLFVYDMAADIEEAIQFFDSYGQLGECDSYITQTQALVDKLSAVLKRQREFLQASKNK